MDDNRPDRAPAPRRRDRRALMIAGLTTLGLTVAIGAVAVTQSVAGALQDQVRAAASPAAAPTPTESVDPEEVYSAVSGQVIETPCWSYEGPALFVNNISDEDTALCVGELELWGEIYDGTVVPTGFGTVYGQVQVEPVRVTTSDSWAPGTDVGAVVDSLAGWYFPDAGEVVSLHEEVTLDGVPANVTRIDSTSNITQTKAFITAFAPHSYTPGADEVRLFVIAVVTPYGNGDELIEQVLDTWRWE